MCHSAPPVLVGFLVEAGFEFLVWRIPDLHLVKRRPIQVLVRSATIYTRGTDAPGRRAPGQES